MSKNPDRTASDTKQRTGELERLGPSGRDVLVLGLDAPGFDELPTQHKALAYYLYRAAIAGNDILYEQNHRHALEIKKLLEAVYTHSDELPTELRDAVHDYLKYIWIHHGNYHHSTHTKFVPNQLTPEGLSQAARTAAACGAPIETVPHESLDEMLARLEPTIFDAEYEALQSNTSRGADAVASSAVNFWDPGITQEDLDALDAKWRRRLNVRFARRGDRIVPEVFKIGGVYGRDLEIVSHFLGLALPLADAGDQRRSLELLLDFYRTGDEEMFRKHCIYWLKSNSTIDYVNGFIEQYIDPHGVIGNFEANVSISADAWLAKGIAGNSLYFEERMPWPDKYKRTTVEPPVAKVVNVLIETGDGGPVSPAAFNLPNYNDIRRDHGSKNVILLNIEKTSSRKLLEKVVEEFFLPEYRENVLRYQHNHMADPKLVELGAFEADEQPAIVETTYVSYAQGWMTRFHRAAGTEVREAHNKGHHLILMYLVNNGGNAATDFGLDVIEHGGDFFVRVRDVDKVRDGVRELLTTVQVMKSTGDGAGAAALFDRFGTHIPKDWYNNMTSRLARLEMPRLKAFVFPHLRPVIEDGHIVDVTMACDEDLTAQQLRFSRLQGVTDVTVD
jgi:dipeptidyl-peptidase-3